MIFPLLPLQYVCIGAKHTSRGGVTFTRDTKMQLESLRLTLEKKKLTLPNNSKLMMQMNSLRYTLSQSGNLLYRPRNPEHARRLPLEPRTRCLRLTEMETNLGSNRRQKEAIGSAYASHADTHPRTS